VVAVVVGGGVGDVDVGDVVVILISLKKNTNMTYVCYEKKESS